MMILRQVSRNAIRKNIVQYVSTTSIKNDENGSKDLPFLSNDKNEDRKTKQSSASTLSDEQLKARERLQKLFRSSESTENEISEVKEVVTKVDVKNIDDRHLKERKRLQDLFKEPESSANIIEVSDVGETKSKEQLKGKQKLQELMQQAETEEVKEKVKLSHPPEKRPVDKVLPTAGTKTHLDLLKAIKEVASEIGGNAAQNEKELIEAVFEVTGSEENEKKRIAEPSPLGDVLSGMNVDKRKSGPRERFRTIFSVQEDLIHQRKKFQREDDGKQPRDERMFNLFDYQRLNIFEEEYIKEVLDKSADKTVLETYDALYKRELKKLITHSPKNIYEEMIKWTEEKKLWHFPIDNEWKWDWENNVEFTEHILLEQHLEPWCPTGGPIRHFMELVCVGLGKNPYITAKEKVEHIYWFRDYFQEKRKLLEEIGAFEQKKLEQAQESF